MNNDDILVAVYMITYNHEEYIEESIMSVLNQKVNFRHKLFIGDDKSSDATSSIIKDLVTIHGPRIDYTLNETNLGASKNAVNIFNKCFNSGARYIAIIEGDDYWCDENKLQKQVEFLESNLGYSMVFHRVFELVDGNVPVLSTLNASMEAETYSIENLAERNFIHTPSVLFRNGLFNSFPEWYANSPVGDYIIHMLNAKQGKIKYFPEPMAVYRRHDNGAWGKKDQVFQSTGWVWMLEHLIAEFKESPIANILAKQKANNEFYIANYYKNRGDKEQYYSWLLASFNSSAEFFREWISNNEHFHESVPEQRQRPTVVRRLLKAIKLKS